MPFAWPSAVPTAALLKEPMIRWSPLWGDPIGRPQRVESGVESKYRVSLGEVADGSRYRLRMDTVRAARRISLLVQHFVPLAAFRGTQPPLVTRWLETRRRASKRAESRSRFLAVCTAGGSFASVLI
jgi:hypothetical protein